METSSPQSGTPQQSGTASRAPTKLLDYLELVKFAHTLFALPFALASMLLAANGVPAWRVIGWILAAMIGARTAAMGFNRIVDRNIDALNPRTAKREIPSGKVSVGQASALVLLSSALFLWTAWELGRLAFWLSWPTLGVLFFYSYCKRFTDWTHFVLGFCLGIAPIGAWVAVRGRLEIAPIILGAAVMLWVAGFDIIYATMDDDFDRKSGIRSMVQRLGIPRALLFSRLLHAGFAVLLWIFGALLHLSPFYHGAIGLMALFLIYEHSLVNERDLRRVNAAFFNVNAFLSLWFLGVVCVQVFLIINHR